MFSVYYFITNIYNVSELIKHFTLKLKLVGIKPFSYITNFNTDIDQTLIYIGIYKYLYITFSNFLYLFVSRIWNNSKYLPRRHVYRGTLNEIQNKRIRESLSEESSWIMNLREFTQQIRNIISWKLFKVKTSMSKKRLIPNFFVLFGSWEKISSRHRQIATTAKDLIA